MKAVISARLLASGKANPGPKPFEIWDRDLRGFILRVQPSGSRSFLVQLGRGRRVTLGSLGHLTPAEARERAEKVLGNLAHNRAPLAGLEANEHCSLRGFIESKYAPWAEANRPRTAQYTVDRLKRCFGDWYAKGLNEITVELIEEWKIDRFRLGRRPSTVLRDIATLSSVLSRAVKMGKISDNPLRLVDKPRIDRRPQVRYLSIDEETRLRDALNERDSEGRQERSSANGWRRERGKNPLPELSYFADHLTPAVIVSINTGVRRGELLSLKWDDIDVKQKLMTIHGGSAKTGDTRHLPLNSEALDALKNWRKEFGSGERVFPISTSFKTAWAALLKRAKIANRFRWHDLRHHFASRLVQAGVPL